MFFLVLSTGNDGRQIQDFEAQFWSGYEKTFLIEADMLGRVKGNNDDNKIF